MRLDPGVAAVEVQIVDEVGQRMKTMVNDRILRMIPAVGVAGQDSPIRLSGHENEQLELIEFGKREDAPSLERSRIFVALEFVQRFSGGINVDAKR